MDTGLLLAPQGFGAMIAMPIAGRLTDRTGIGRIVPVGLVLVGVSFLGLTQLAATRPTGCFGVLLFVMGLGMGATMMPTFSGAMQTLRRAAIARASTTLNINQQVGASIGTAVLQRAARQRARRPPAGQRRRRHRRRRRVPPEPRADRRADGRGVRRRRSGGRSRSSSVAFVVAMALLPKQKPEPVDDPDEAEGAESAGARARRLEKKKKKKKKKNGRR